MDTRGNTHLIFKNPFDICQLNTDLCKVSRIVAIDYGSKRCGIAMTDNLQIIAKGLTTVHSTELVAFLEDLFVKEIIDRVIIGLPKNLRNEDTDATDLVERFIKHFKKKFPDRIIQTVDERFTSSMAKAAILQSGAKKKDRQNKALVDETSAAIMLQSYLQMKNESYL